MYISEQLVREQRLWIPVLLLTLVSEFEPLPVLRVVAVEVDEGFVRRAEQRGGQLGAAELPDQGAAAVRTVLNFKVVMISFGGKIQKLNMCTYEKVGRRSKS